MDIDQIKYHFNKIYRACDNSFMVGCGSYLFNGHQYVYDKKNYPKQKLLYDVVKNKENALEVGVYMGHSLLIMLVSNPNIQITAVDIMDKYSLPAIKYLRNSFPKSKIDFIKGNSLKVLPNLKKKFNFFHIDGYHSNYVATKDFKQCKKMSQTEVMSVLIDDISSCIPLKKDILKNHQIKLKRAPLNNDNLYLEIYINDVKSLNKFNIVNLNIIEGFKYNMYIFFSKLASNQIGRSLKKNFPKIAKLINKILV